jgi:hypothetical protein
MASISEQVLRYHPTLIIGSKDSKVQGVQEVQDGSGT